MLDKMLRLLGLTVTDKVTGLTGVITTVSLDLYGCAQVWITPPAEKKDLEGGWYDVQRCTVDHSIDRAMPLPQFASYSDPLAYDKGAAKNTAPRQP